MKITEYSIETKKNNIDQKICIVSDLHSRSYQNCLDAIKSTSPDIIILAGDILERLDGKADKQNKLGFEFLENVGKIAPTYYTFGNHERFGSHKEMRTNPVSTPWMTEENLKMLRATKVSLVNDSYLKQENFIIGGIIPINDMTCEKPVLNWLDDFSSFDEFKILVSHQPEYFDKYLKDFDFDLMISGHTHGGQWKFFGRGVWAPNQGLLPKYSSGVYHNRLVVSSGATNTAKMIPRFFNPCEIVLLNIKSV